MDGAELRAWRLRHGITQAALAFYLGASQSLISRIERGERPATTILRPEYWEGQKPGPRIEPSITQMIEELFALSDAEVAQYVAKVDHDADRVRRGPYRRRVVGA